MRVDLDDLHRDLSEELAARQAIFHAKREEYERLREQTTRADQAMEEARLNMNILESSGARLLIMLQEGRDR